MSGDDLLTFREHFPTLENCTYLISNSLGAMPRGAREGLTAYADTWTDRGVRAWAETWWELPRRVGNTIGRLINAPADTVSMHQNVTLASAIVISAFDWGGERNRVVYTDMNFPSVKYLYTQFATERGAQIVEVPSPDGIHVPTEAVLDAIDERTCLVPISHVLFRSAYIQDAKAICEKARSVGAHVVLDAYQSVGTVPVDVQEIGCSFLLGGTLKWMCGGPGNVFLYVRPDLLETFAPRLTGWMAHPRPFDFAAPPMAYTEGSYRFMHGTPNIPALYAAEAGTKLLIEAGMDAVRAKSRRHTARLVELAQEREWTITTPLDPDRRGGTVAFDVPHAYEVKLELLRREVIVDYRPGAGIRVSPHFYNSDEEAERAVFEIDDILATGAWEQHAGVKHTVT